MFSCSFWPVIKVCSVDRWLMFEPKPQSFMRLTSHAHPAADSPVGRGASAERLAERRKRLESSRGPGGCWIEWGSLVFVFGNVWFFGGSCFQPFACLFVLFLFFCFGLVWFVCLFVCPDLFLSLLCCCSCFVDFESIVLL